MFFKIFALQKSSTILFFIFFISAFLLSTYSDATFSSDSFSSWGNVLSWIPSSCKTIFVTFLSLLDVSSSIIFRLSSSFFFLILSLCSINLFFLSYCASTFDYSCFYSVRSSFFIYYFFYSEFEIIGVSSSTNYFLGGDLRGGKSLYLDFSPIGFSFFFLFTFDFSWTASSYSFFSSVLSSVLSYVFSYLIYFCDSSFSFSTVFYI